MVRCDSRLRRMEKFFHWKGLPLPLLNLLGWRQGPAKRSTKKNSGPGKKNSLQTSDPCQDHLPHSHLLRYRHRRNLPLFLQMEWWLPPPQHCLSAASSSTTLWCISFFMLMTPFAIWMITPIPSPLCLLV